MTSCKDCTEVQVVSYGPADAAAIPKPHHLLPHPDWFCLSGTKLTLVLLETGVVV